MFSAFRNMLLITLSCGLLFCYCGADITTTPSPNYRNLLITADNCLEEIYIDGLKYDGNLGNKCDIDDYDVVPVPPGNRLIAVRATGAKGILMRLNELSGQMVWTSYPGDWKCRTCCPNNWFSLDFDDSAWLQARESGKGEYNKPDGMQFATWIWGETENKEVICRRTTACEQLPNCQTTVRCSNTLDAICDQCKVGYYGMRCDACDAILLCKSGLRCTKSGDSSCDECISGVDGPTCDSITAAGHASDTMRQHVKYLCLILLIIHVVLEE